MPESCVVWQPAKTTDGMGGETVEYTWTHSYPCRVASNGIPQQYLAAAKLMDRTAYMVTLPYDADVKDGDHLEIVLTGLTLEVMGVVRGVTWQTAIRALCQKVD